MLKPKLSNTKGTGPCPPVTARVLFTVASFAVQYTSLDNALGIPTIGFAVGFETTRCKATKSLLFNKLPNVPDVPGSPPGNPNGKPVLYAFKSSVDPATSPDKSTKISMRSPTINFTRFT